MITLDNLEVLQGEYIIKRYGATLAEYERLANEDTRIELLDGVLIVHSPANWRHEKLFWFLGRLVSGFVESHDLGEVTGSRTAVILNTGRRVEPDLLFVKRDRMDIVGEVFVSGNPDLVVEILSPATRDYDLGEKRKAYADAGVPEYWMLDLAGTRFLVDRPAGVRATEMQKGRYDCHVIPGFWIDVAWLWQWPLPNPRNCLEQIEQESRQSK